MLVDGAPISASLFDFGLYLFHNGAAAHRGRAAGRTSTSPSSSRTTRRGSGTRSSSTPRRRSGSRAGRSGRPCSSRRSSPRSRWTRSCTSCASTPRASTPGAGTTCSAASRSSGRRPDLAVAGPRPADDDRAVHAGVHGAARPDLPSARGARDRRDGGVHPEPARPGGHRGRAGQGPRRQGARESATGSTGRGSPIPTSCRSRLEVFDGVLGDRPNQKDRLREEVVGRRRGAARPARRRAAPSPRPASGRTSGSRWRTSTRGCAASARPPSTT